MKMFITGRAMNILPVSERMKLFLCDWEEKKDQEQEGEIFFKLILH